MKNFAIAAVVAASFVGAMPAQADVTRTLSMNFASGAHFTGTVTFVDDYSKLTGVSGTLFDYTFETGYTGSGSDSINWVWNDGANFSSGDGNYADWLMDGPGSGYSGTGGFFNYILLAYNYSNAPTLLFTTGVTGYGDNYINYNDPMVSGSFGDVSSPAPEPASWALMLGGFGLVGGAMRSRRKAALNFG
jgi:hypothetical protein